MWGEGRGIQLFFFVGGKKDILEKIKLVMVERMKNKQKTHRDSVKIQFTGEELDVSFRTYLQISKVLETYPFQMSGATVLL